MKRVEKKEIVILDSNERQRHGLCKLLTSHHYRTVQMNVIDDLEAHLHASDCRAVILNLDNVQVTNKIIKNLRHKSPMTSIIAVSERQFHPELEESFREHISVCLKQPLDSDELVYWLRTIFVNDEETNGQLSC